MNFKLNKFLPIVFPNVRLFASIPEFKNHLQNLETDDILRFLCELFLYLS